MQIDQPVDEKKVVIKTQQCLAIWQYCMKKKLSSVEALDDNMVRIREVSSENLDFGEFAAAAAYLKALGQDVPPDGLDYIAHNFLKGLHHVLLRRHAPSLEPQGESQTIQKLYQLYDNNPDAFLAALAIYDVHLEMFVDRQSGLRILTPTLPLFEWVFLPIVMGLNMWAIRRRWLMAYHRFHNPRELDEIAQLYEEERENREAAARHLIRNCKEFLAQRGCKAQIAIYDRTPASLFRSSINRNEIVRAIVLKITCEKEEDCYLSMMWFHQQGDVINELSRHSLFHAEENGTRRVQVGIHFKDRLVIARIGLSEEMNYYNEWGALTRLKKTRSPRLGTLVAQSMSNENRGDGTEKITIFKWTGDKVSLDANSTIADLVIQEYPFEQARHCTEARVNAIKYPLGHVLQEGDVVQIFWDRWKQKRLPVSAWQGSHRYPETWQAVSYLRSQEQQEALRGRLRILYVIQNYLAPWGFMISENELTWLLKADGFDMQRQTLDEVLDQLIMDHSKDQQLCELALQFNLYQYVQTKQGDPLSVSWRHLRLAQCCRPTINDEIIGNRIVGPLNPDNPDYKQEVEIKIHRKNCSDGPEERNRIHLRWVKHPSRDHIRHGMKIHLQAEDRRGFLGELIDLIYTQTDLSIHYVNADAVNYGLNLHGQKIANAILYVSANTGIELNEAFFLLRHKYGHEKVSTARLQPGETRQLTQVIRFNPYITESEPELIRQVPVLMVGRDSQIKEVMTLLHQRKNIHIAVEGYYRSGKTWFLNYLQDHYLNPYELLVYIPFDAYTQERIQEKDIVHGIYLRTLKTLNNADPATGVRLRFNRPGTFFELQTWFEKVRQSTGYYFTLLLDEFSILSDWRLRGYIDKHFQERFYRFMYEAPTVGFVMVFQSAVVQGLRARDEQFWEWFYGRCDKVVYMEPFDEQEIAQLLCDPVKTYYEFEPDVVQEAWRLSGGNPYLTAQLGRTIFGVADKNGLTKIDESTLSKMVKANILPLPEWQGYLRRMVEHLPEESFEIIKIIARLQCQVNQHYVPISEFQSVVHNKLDIQLEQLGEVLRKLKDAYLLCTNDDSNNEELLAWKLCSNLLAQYLAMAN